MEKTNGFTGGRCLRLNIFPAALAAGWRQLTLETGACLSPDGASSSELEELEELLELSARELAMDEDEVGWIEEVLLAADPQDRR